ncbi:hypothetical pox protein [Squirrelpox virus]|uniref:Hypothetical pox protein n=1 Tax=Squirrelpox virus TaxID=240426 RepID=Q1HTU6_9POXV|nr:hypothetical pox protein [Squirrelpox virus]ABD51440.1 I4L [Squirrelpox virus]CCD83189.1 hypothetical pox protein [Squirrelpox virus]
MRESLLAAAVSTYLVTASASLLTKGQYASAFVLTTAAALTSATIWRNSLSDTMQRVSRIWFSGAGQVSVAGDEVDQAIRDLMAAVGNAVNAHGNGGGGFVDIAAGDEYFVLSSSVAPVPDAARRRRRRARPASPPAPPAQAPREAVPDLLACAADPMLAPVEVPPPSSPDLRCYETLEDEDTLMEVQFSPEIQEALSEFLNLENMVVRAQPE